MIDGVWVDLGAPHVAYFGEGVDFKVISDPAELFDCVACDA